MRVTIRVARAGTAGREAKEGSERLGGAGPQSGCRAVKTPRDIDIRRRAGRVVERERVLEFGGCVSAAVTTGSIRSRAIGPVCVAPHHPGREIRVCGCLAVFGDSIVRIVRDAIERVGCSLRVQTSAGRGTRFSLLIPEWRPIRD